MTDGQGQPAELTIGVIGPHDLVERVMLSASTRPVPATAEPPPAGWPPPTGWLDVSVAGPGAAVAGPGAARRLVAAAYRTEQEAPDKVLRLGPGIDVYLFASRVPCDYTRRAGALHAPATWVPLAGSALLAALLRAGRDSGLDLSRVSVDVLARDSVQEALGELGVEAGEIHLREDTGNAAALAAFHERLWRRHQTTVAFTCLESVAQRLAPSGMPVFVVRPTGSAIRSALRTATLLAGQRHLEEAQLAVAVVEVPTLRETGGRHGPRQSREELRLTVHRFLLQETQRIQATVSPLGDYSFLVTATRGSLAGATGGFRAAPFSERARTELGIALEVGVGLGGTAQDAEAHARAALARSHAGPDGRGFALDRDGRPVAPTPLTPAPATQPKGLETLARLAARLPRQESAHVVDAETAGRLLGVTPRSARRLLHSLLEEGLAWPLPPQRTPLPGRPRQYYRLVTERLDNPPG